METLPCEMVLKVSELLTIEDLARCCRVSKGWRAAFNRDWLWKPHCDSDLEEHLRTTPATVEPVFVIPGGEDSTLTPICRWRLAFLREKHLRSNWKHNNRRTESLLELKNEVHMEFFTNTLVVRWFPKYFEVWDVSVDPAVFVAKTDTSVVDIDNWIDRFLERNLLVVRQIKSVKVFFVNIIDKSIDLKFDISLDDVINAPADSDYMRELQTSTRFSSGMDCVKGNVLVHVNASRSNLDIFDLETGIKIKEEPCPQVDIDGTKCEVSGVSTSRTSDYVVVVVRLQPGNNSCYYYIYNPQKLCFLRGPLAQIEGHVEHTEIHRHYFAVANVDFLNVYDCHSCEIIVRKAALPVRRTIFIPAVYGFYSPELNDNFLYKEAGGPMIFLEMFDLPNNTMTVVECPSVANGFTSALDGSIQSYKVFNNKLLTCFDWWLSHWYLLLDNVWVECDIPFEEKTTINHAFTKIILHDTTRSRSRELPFGQKEWYIYHYW